MRLVLAIAALLALFAFAPARAQTLCVKYGGSNQTNLLETVIGAVVTAVVSDPVLLPWFNGTNNDPGKNFLAPSSSAILANLENHLIGFFGHALGCNDPAFASGGKYDIANVNVNMTDVHRAGSGGFAKAITKQAYELFNIHILDVLAGAGVTKADLYTVSQVLDPFRGPALNGGSASYTNSVCQDPDCSQSPFTVYMRDNSATGATTNYFAPSYYKVPKGGSVVFANKGLNSHQPIQSSAAGSCTAASGGWSSSSISGGSSTTYTTPAQNTVGTEYFVCSIHCASGMNGSFDIVNAASPSPSTTTSSPSSSTGGAATLVLAFSAVLAMLFVMLF